VSAIEAICSRLHDNLVEYSSYDKAGAFEPPTALLWLYYFLGQVSILRITQITQISKKSSDKFLSLNCCQISIHNVFVLNPNPFYVEKNYV
jgi:hypothetical protein